MDNFEGQTRPRQVIVDVQSMKSSGHKRRKRKRNRHHNSDHVPHYTVEQHQIVDDDDEVLDQQIPMELKPVIDATMAYARQTHALGVLRGARELEFLVKRIESIATRLSDPELLNAIADARTNISVLRSEFKKGYNVEDEVPGV